MTGARRIRQHEDPGVGFACKRADRTLDVGGTTHVDVETDFTITGRLARFGRGGMIKDISNRLLRDFSECLQARIESAHPPAAEGGSPSTAAEQAPAEPAPAPAPAAKPVSGFSLAFRALLDRLQRLFKRG